MCVKLSRGETVGCKPEDELRLVRSVVGLHEESKLSQGETDVLPFNLA